LPLITCVLGYLCGNSITIEDEAIEHQNQVDIRDAPLIKEIPPTMCEQQSGTPKQFLGSDVAGCRQGCIGWLIEDDLCCPVLTQCEQITAQPRLNLTCACPLLH